MKNILIAGVGVLLVGMSATFGFLYFTQSGNSQQPDIGAAKAAKPKETFYFALAPEFIVNFQEQTTANYLMLDVTVASQDSRIPTVLDTHSPEIRNDLLMLFSSHANEELYTVEGKTALREKATESVRSVLQKHYPQGEISDLFFTRFVMQ